MCRQFDSVPAHHRISGLFARNGFTRIGTIRQLSEFVTNSASTPRRLLLALEVCQAFAGIPQNCLIDDAVAAIHRERLVSDHRHRG